MMEEERIKEEEQKRREEERRRQEDQKRTEEERKRKEEERRRQEEQKRIEEERKKEELSQRVQESRERAKEQYEKQQRSRQEQQSKHNVMIGLLDEFEAYCKSYSGKDELLEILSLKCNIEASDLSLTTPKADLLGKILSALDNLLFDEWINDPPSGSTLQHAQVYITELCALSVEIPEELSRENISNHVQSLVESISQSACNIFESLELIQAMYLTVMHYISENDKSDADAVIIAKKWAKEELTMEQLFPLDFLSILISSMHGTVGKTSIFILKMEIQCLKLLISTLVNLNGKESLYASTEIILDLVRDIKDILQSNEV
ncbi:mRNA export factor GLE1-like [Girardinichthys multiradiatus]|uniref:mRNA export factor GLE1-like n=1 Tax=Girardinichthys multiradiatus TaxID=208333 RepID=UPI001FAD1A8A|nr:mRNA export factor GLE1-like [Girardinichthys multiradiatus]